MNKKIYNIEKDTAKILNGIRSACSDEYKARVPILGTPGGAGDEYITDNLAQVVGAITSYTPNLNEFLQTAVNRIGALMIQTLSFTNPLKAFKKGKLEFGEVVEQIWVGLATSSDYQWNSGEQEENPFARQVPDVKTYFHEMNVQKVFKATTTNAEVALAMTGANGVYNVIQAIVNSLFSSYEIFEWEQTKKVLADAYDNGDIVEVVLDGSVDINKDLIKKARAMSRKFTMPSKDYNAAGVVQTCKSANQYIIITADLEAEIDVDVLASAFNMDKTTFMGHRIVIDSFGPDMDYVKAMLVDENFFNIWDKLFEVQTAFNSAQLYTNYFLHVWQIYSYSEVHNAVCFVTEEQDDTKLKSIKVGNLALTPSFDKSTTAYTATATTGATAKVTATKVDSKAELEIKHGDTEIDSGDTITFTEGANVLTFKVTKGNATKTYTVTVTAS